MTTTAPAPVGTPSTAVDHAPRRRRVVRRIVWGLALLALLVLASVLPEPRTSSDPLAPDSTSPNGSRALAQILGRQGVKVEHVDRLAEAIRSATEGSTLLVTEHGLISEDQVSRLAATPADLVLVNPDWLVGWYSAQLLRDDSWGSSESSWAAGCSVPAAQAAGSLSWANGGFRAAEGASPELCFRDDSGAAGLAVVTEGGRTISALATGAPLTNEALVEEGNAALALHLLGANEKLVWYTPDRADLWSEDSSEPEASPSDLLPEWVGFVGIQLLVLVAFLALWRGRRLGRLVPEPLPVVVQAAETTRGRGRLYRRARAYGRAAASLRAAAASRCAHRLGLPRSAGAEAVLDELVRATSRPREELALLLYGPPPTSDTGLTDLARELDRLESEVNRP